MKVFTNVTFEGHWPVGSAAVVVAETADLAAESLEKELRGMGLPQPIKAADMLPLSLDPASVRILCDGNY